MYWTRSGWRGVGVRGTVWSERLVIVLGVEVCSLVPRERTRSNGKRQVNFV